MKRLGLLVVVLVITGSACTVGKDPIVGEWTANIRGKERVIEFKADGSTYCPDKNIPWPLRLVEPPPRGLRSVKSTASSTPAVVGSPSRTL